MSQALHSLRMSVTARWRCLPVMRGREPFSWGYVDGLLGANCRHSIGPGDGEFNPYEHFDSEENRLRVERDERMRLLERRIRASRREVMALQEAVDKAPDGAVKAGAEAAYRRKAKVLMRQEKEYDDFCAENNTRKLYDRLAVARYGAKQARAAEKAARSTVESTPLTEPAKTGIIDQKRQPEGKPDVHTVGRIDIEKYKCVTEDIRTDEVIITDERIAHIQEHHPGEYEKVRGYLERIIQDPDYIMEDKKNPTNTGLLLKRIEENGEPVQLILRLLTSKDKKGYKNSILSAWTIGEDRWKNYERNRKILYKKE